VSETPPAPPLPPAPALPPQPQPPRFLGQFALLYGLGLGTLVYAIGYGLAVAGSGGLNSDGSWALAWLAVELAITVLVVVGGITLTVIGYTRAFGSGVLISLAMGLIVGNGVCIALLSSQ
jgi:hypothetical protein